MANINVDHLWMFKGFWINFLQYHGRYIQQNFVLDIWDRNNDIMLARVLKRNDLLVSSKRYENFRYRSVPTETKNWELTMLPKGR